LVSRFLAAAPQAQILCSCWLVDFSLQHRELKSFAHVG
jgi:hypothetical protein